MVNSRRQVSPLSDVNMFSSVRAYVRELQHELADCETVLDIGCGKCSPLRFIEGSRLTAVDAYEPDLKAAAEAGTHDEYVLCRAEELEDRFGERSVDACVALDMIEHLTEKDGLALLRRLESIARRKVVISTPNGFLPQTGGDGDLQEHLSGWDAPRMRELGYRVVGMYGLKPLRGEYQKLRFQPTFFWALVSWITHLLWCRNHPETAAAILCVKDVH